MSSVMRVCSVLVVLGFYIGIAKQTFGGTTDVCSGDAAMTTACGAAIAVPDDPDNKPGPNGEPAPGLKGWLLHMQTDEAGNKAEQWCLDLPGTGPGNSFGWRYIPKGGTPVWMGRCYFNGATNKHNKEPVDEDKDSKPDYWRTFWWKSEDDGGGGATDRTDDDKKPGKQDWEWIYTPANNKIKSFETNDGKRVRPDLNGPAPLKYEDLIAVALPPPNPEQIDAPMFMAAATEIRLAGRFGQTWEYELSGPTLLEFSPTVVYPGDSWSISAKGIFDAQAPIDWAVSTTDTYTRWTYTGLNEFNLSASGPLSGFTISSTFTTPGTGYWLTDSIDDELANFGYDGTTLVPVPEPPCLAMFAAGLLAFARCYSKPASLAG